MNNVMIKRTDGKDEQILRPRSDCACASAQATYRIIGALYLQCTLIDTGYTDIGDTGLFFMTLMT